MNLRDLKYFISVAELKHFGKAAEACFVSQPTLSTQIKKLEEELGVQLFERGMRTVLLTSAGEVVLAHARQALREIDDLKSAAKREQDPYQEPITIGILPTIAPYLLPVIMPQLSKKLPKLKLVLHELQTHQCLQQLELGLVDGVVLATPVLTPNKLIGKILFSEEFSLIMHQNDPLTKRKKITMVDIDPKQLLLLDEGHCLRDQALEACEFAAIEHDNNFRGTSLETIAHMVSAGMGMTFIPGLAEAHFSQLGLQIKSLQDAPHRQLALLWRAGSSRKALLEDIAELIRFSCINIRGVSGNDQDYSE
ncbi:LysR substrate-binding domain-containing protein [Piscirickettsia salmonis]|uniref:LysR substrate-binding domain-containing protein n=1 Tax=Piscirickettsia salmonis TaxID=1238 RepID=UPI0002F3D9E9|nr:LysR substrate-binding domain-containing protein [Piscirickettsia salmonis]APS57412.1 hypothetical protein AVI52_09230 [Piscirickettsia salmonis]ERL61265.1 LysR substrate binding domain protein [Piscirickettsia salmonis LF-89 = ATCC VR-1361]PEQ16729.1 DNA-binding transcriptional regulator OxyR [Piscirickettsia salmonis]QGN78832.1 Morphology and auto-aggregation control protein [Piscirickettsia salmonis]QGN82417.1 Morphology and auto-aggregation control protein [Piscirickettsia salmonis]